MGIIHDPISADMLSRGSAAFVRSLDWPVLRRFARSPSMAYLAARTIFFDSLVADELERGIRQVVVVGAGYDARAWRFARPGVTFYEVDHPATQTAKRRLVPPPPDGVEVRFVPADLIDEDIGSALLAAGLDPAAPCHVLVEGLTMYLDEENVRSVWRALRRVAPPGSTLSANFSWRGGGASSIVSGLISAAIRVRWRQVGEPTLSWASRAAVEHLHETTGWRLDAVETGLELATRLEEQTTLPAGGVSDHVLNTVATRPEDPLDSVPRE